MHELERLQHPHARSPASFPPSAGGVDLLFLRSPQPITAGNSRPTTNFLVCPQDFCLLYVIRKRIPAASSSRLTIFQAAAMNSAIAIRRPLGCLKATFRHSRQKRLSLRRSIATTARRETAQEPLSSSSSPAPTAALSGLKIRTSQLTGHSPFVFCVFCYSQDTDQEGRNYPPPQRRHPHRLRRLPASTPPA